MAKPAQLGFNAGIFGKRMQARSELARYRYACRSMTNFIPTVQGPALKRSGTRFVKTVKNQAKNSRLIPFEFSLDQAYVLEFSDNAIRFMRDGGAVLETAVNISAGTPPTIANPCVITTATNHGYSTGDEVFITGSRLAFLNDQYFTVTVTGLTTFTVATNGGSAISSVGESLIAAGTNTVARTYQIVDGVSSNSIPWNETDLDGIQVAQDADVMFIAHPSYAPHKLTRVSDTSWTCAEIAFVWPPFRDENITDTTVYVSSATSATSTIQSSTDIFTSDMVGGYIKVGELVEAVHPKWIESSNMDGSFASIGVGDRVYYNGRVFELDDMHGASKTGTIPPVHEEGIEQDRPVGENAFDWEFINRGWGFAKIESFTDANTVVADVLNEGIVFPDSVVGSSNATKKWAISAFNAEFGYPAAVAIFEQRLWFGGTEKDPQTFWGSRINRYEDFEIRDGDPDSGLLFTLADGQINAIQWMTGEDALIIGTRGGEFTAQSGSAEEGITPDNIKVKRMSAFGSASNVAARFVDSTLVMAHRSGRRLHALNFDLETDRYQGIDLTSTADEILADGIIGIEYQGHPFRQIFGHTTSGYLRTFTFIREEDVTGWATFAIAAASGGTGTVESVCVIPHPDGDTDQVWLSVVRNNGGGTVRWIEYLEKPFEEGDSIGDAFFVDGGLSYVGSATTTITGLLHLAGVTVTYLTGLGTTVGTATVSAKGTITIASTTKAHVGFPVKAALETMDFEMGKVPFDSSMVERARVVSAAFRLSNTGTGFQFASDAAATTFDPYSQTDALFTGITPQLTVPGGSRRGPRVAVIHETPLPCTLEAIYPKIEVGES